ncbi:hypothetical protein BD410DRAFT_82000 [Rickenella mellea]|uniref:Uncharacterized protein n=1 Tax=Rickenella mellea TaxID=50990 RepID=A0A4Y7PKX6_9AGAM|nr:hypothetical protein BD410DRAFT_82000 [Rickenella mellea]
MISRYERFRISRWQVTFLDSELVHIVAPQVHSMKTYGQLSHQKPLNATLLHVTEHEASFRSHQHFRNAIRGDVLSRCLTATRHTHETSVSCLVGQLDFEFSYTHQMYR